MVSLQEGEGVRAAVDVGEWVRVGRGRSLLGEKFYEVLSAHAVRDQAWDGGHARTKQIDLWLPLAPVVQRGS